MVVSYNFVFVVNLKLVIGMVFGENIIVNLNLDFLVIVVVVLGGRLLNVNFGGICIGMVKSMWNVFVLRLRMRGLFGRFVGMEIGIRFVLRILSIFVVNWYFFL